MNKLMNIAPALAIASPWTLPAGAQEADPPPAAAAEPRELIYCGGMMTPAEREACRAHMRTARAPQERAALSEQDVDDVTACLNTQFHKF